MKKILRHKIDCPLIDEIESPLLRRIYAARGISSLDEIDYQLKKLLNPASLLNIDKATAILYEALIKEQKVLVIGDYDTDGATSTALAVSALKTFGFKKINYLVPNRFTFGYGLSEKIVEHAKKVFDPDLIITVDNGTSSIDGVAKAKELDIKVLVTDHHLAPETLPEASAIINPNQPGDNFPSKNLAGVGVIFYVMLALRSKLREEKWFEKSNLKEPNMAQFLSLVALGTVADLVPLDYNNRILVRQGLIQIRNNKNNFGIHALITIAKRNLNLLRASDLAFAVAPRLNAAGRLDDMSRGINCLLSDNKNDAETLANELNELNKTRREVESKMQIEALTYLEKLQLDKKQSLPAGISLFDPTWHQGVIGILASRIKDKTNRPVIAFSKSNETELKGSGRSVEGVHIRDLLSDIASSHPHIITKFGGHSQAAGLTIEEKYYKEFSDLFASEVAKKINLDDLQGKIYTDGELTQQDFSLKTAEELYQAGPFGQGFPAPIFEGIFSLVEQRLVGQKHLKMTLKIPQTRLFLDAISFNVDLRKWPNHRSKKVFLVYRLDINEYLDRRKIQLLVEELLEA